MSFPVNLIPCLEVPSSMLCLYDTLIIWAYPYLGLSVDRCYMDGCAGRINMPKEIWFITSSNW